MHHVLAFLSAFALLSTPVSAQDYLSNGIRGELVAGVTDSYDRLIDLAQAIPERQFAWRPGEGVRSIREVLLHVIGSSYYFTNLVGTPHPDGLDPGSLEAELSSKEAVIASLMDARDHTLDAMISLDAAALDRRVKWYGGAEGTVRGALLLLSNQTSEHLGQLIAYARMNGIPPPWSEE